jgi:hypothetical protein
MTLQIGENTVSALFAQSRKTIVEKLFVIAGHRSHSLNSLRRFGFLTQLGDVGHPAPFNLFLHIGQQAFRCEANPALFQTSLEAFQKNPNR